MIEIIKGNIFTTKCQVIVNTVNCVGVMGAGIALECRLRYPDMYGRYVELCNQHKIDIGNLWLYKSSTPWILNVPTKKDWKKPSSVSYLRAGLDKFCQTYESKDIHSIAFPLLGADKGGIDQEVSLDIMTEYLSDLDLKVEIYRYDPKASDDLYDKLKSWMLSNDETYISSVTGVRKNYIHIVMQSLDREDICQLNQLAHIKGVGIVTLEKLFRFAIADTIDSSQKSLF
ncbi:macro domain-containing protein [Neptuniibacter sp.]|uniref:macro domain-containing protein n=1 Tax=Neptuniibacter sp. TaxID=1962643 RepID=UPI00262869D8|nr:macro domain-containing protein [Neptuniibacter sp.]MCP4596142.1 macro domain-containing protein [Neptuniibacter sp.]